MEETEYQKTEQFALEKEEEEKIWQETWGVKLPKLLMEMDVYIQEATKESRDRLCNLLMDEKLLDPYRGCDEVTDMYMAAQLYQMEQAQGIMHTILDQGNSVEAIRTYLNQLRFILYRIEFEIDKSSEEELADFLKKNNTSAATMDFMMFSAVIKKESMAFKLEKLFEKYGLYSRQRLMGNGTKGLLK